VVAHQERISFFCGDGLRKTLLHSKRFVARGVCDDGGEGLDDAHLVEILRSFLMVVVLT
jgi:hypothetical protein